MNMDVKTKKLDIIEWLVHLTDESIVEQLYNFKKNSKENLLPRLSKEEKLGIERGLIDYNEEKISSHDEVTDRIKSKFPFLK